MKKKSGLSYSNFYYYLLLIAPLFLIYIVFFIVPVVSSLFLSMTNYNGLSLDVKFTGLNNYIVAFSDKVFRKAMWNTILFAGLATLLQNGLALLLALGLNAKIKGRGFMRMLVFAPCMISPIITAFVWQFIFMPEGLLNRMLGAVGIGRMDKAWLGSVDTALVCVVCAHVWMWIGYSATIYLSNLIVCLFCGLIMCLGFIICYCLAGIPLLGFFTIDLRIILILIFCSILCAAASSACCVMVAMLCQNKALSAIICVLGAFVLLIGATYVHSQLNQPETYATYELTNNGDEPGVSKTVPNPRYLTGAKRTVYEFIYDFVPPCQAVQLANLGVAHPWRLPLY